MERTSKMLLVVISFLLLIIGCLIFYSLSVRNKRCDVKTSEELSDYAGSDIEVDDQTASAKAAVLSVDVVGTLVWWDQDQGFSSIEDHLGSFTVISPFWYELDERVGEIKPYTGAGNEDVLSYLDDSGVEVWPMISNEFHRLPIADMISDTERSQEHIDEIVSLAVDNDFEGISIDYESLEDTDRGRYTTFIADLASALHDEDKKLSVHLHAKVSEPGTWNGPQAQDWEGLAQSADALKIMAYDYHWSTSEPGAIAPITWVEDVLQFAVTVIPKEKIYLGIGLYGYNWGDGDAEAESLTYQEAMELAESLGQTVQFDQIAKSPHFSYLGDDGINHEVWFENGESFKAKAELVQEYGIGGVSLFRLGGEDETIYDEMVSVLSSSE